MILLREPPAILKRAELPLYGGLTPRRPLRSACKARFWQPAHAYLHC
jgi:hypothetical protein